jgi:major capsid protein
MSTGGIFQLITNDGKQDKLLMATEYLSARLADIKKSRAGMEDENPTLADIEKTHVLFMNAHFKPFAAMAYEYNKVTLSNATLGSTLQFSIPQFGDFFNDMVLHLILSAPTPSLTVTGTSTAGDVALYKWCDWPGERICNRVSFDVNGNPLDEYYNDAYNMHRQFRVGVDKLNGWSVNMGQEKTKEAYYQYAETAAATAPGSTRGVIGIRNGYQTYAPSHPDLELFIPILFWFNTDPSLSIPSVAIPYGQRYINVDLNPASQLVRVVANPAAPGADTLPVITTPAIATCELYINNIFVQPDIHDIFIKRIGFSLVRVHRRQITNINKSADQILLQQLKWPIETIYCGLQPTANITPNPTLVSTGAQTCILDPNMEDWHRFSQISTSVFPSGTTNGITTPYILKTETNHVQFISIIAHGIQLYNNLPAQFFNSYVPYTYGGWNINTPTDPGLFMIGFNLYPGSYQPSGHVNVSRAREFYFQYSSTYVTSTLTANLVINAAAINFLLISDGSAIMRYTT